MSGTSPTGALKKNFYNINKLKHGISFAGTFAVFDDPNAVTVED
jgi:uncharacterized DUF497 family protein